MGFESKGFGRCMVVCDDPHKKGCRAEFGPLFGQSRTARLAGEQGWYYSEATSKYVCPKCMGLHTEKVEQAVSSGALTRETANENGDPFTAALISMALGGDPLIAAGATMLTGNTGLGIIAGVMFGDKEKPQEENLPVIVQPFAEEAAQKEFASETAPGAGEETSPTAEISASDAAAVQSGADVGSTSDNTSY